jgi:hypothetical protein
METYTNWFVGWNGIKYIVEGDRAGRVIRTIPWDKATNTQKACAKPMEWVDGYGYRYAQACD